MRNERVNYILIISVTVLIIFLTIGTAIAPDIGLSENENRYLKQKPELSVKNILDGSYETQAEEYLSDQIIGREKWVSLMANTLKLIGYKDINGTFVLRDGRLIEKTAPKDFDFDRFTKNLNEVKKLSEEIGEWDIPLDAVIVPSAAFSMKDKYDIRGIFNESKAQKMAEEIIGDDLVSIKEDFYNSDNLFFYTDHHWNAEGAYRAYVRYAAESLNTVKPSYESLKMKTLTSDFKGTLYSKVLLNDRISDEIKVPEESLNIKTVFTAEGIEYDSIYIMDKLNQKDKYEVYLGGNYDRADIVLPDNKGLPKLLIVKDSFANSFVPYLLDDFSCITLVDTRYYRQNIADLAIDDDYDRVLVLYGMANFAKEKLNLTAGLLG